MPFDAVGGYPEGSGSEEAHRPPLHRNTALGVRDQAGRPAVLGARFVDVRLLASSRRFRLQAAGLAALALILLLSLIFPARKVHIAADGRVTTVTSRASSDTAVVEQAGIELGPGDRVEDAGENELVVRRATEAILKVDGNTYAMHTQATTIDELLAEADVPLAPDDSVLRDQVFVSAEAPVAPLETVRGESGATSGRDQVPTVTLEVRRAVPFTVVENGQELQLRSSRETISAALRDVGVRLGAGDAVQPAPSTALTAGMEVHVEHAAQLVVTLPEGKAVVYTLADAVGEAIAESGIALPSTYRLEPAPETPVKAGLAVHIIAISNELVQETERIQSYTVYQPDPSLPPGTQRVVPGQDGVLYRQYNVVYQNDVLVSREFAAEWYDPEPVDTIVYYSTAAAPVAQPAAADWQDLVCSYDWDCAWALAVIYCESGGNPNAYNPQGPYVGLFQIWEGHGANLRDPATNIAAAYSLYLSGGRGNWPNCP